MLLHVIVVMSKLYSIILLERERRRKERERDSDRESERQRDRQRETEREKYFFQNNQRLSKLEINALFSFPSNGSMTHF